MLEVTANICAVATPVAPSCTARVHAVAPELAASVPSAHFLQYVVPISAANMPAGQSMHRALPGAAFACPRAHSTHASSAPTRDVPAEHGLHRLSPPMSTNPSGQVLTQCEIWLLSMCTSSGGAQTSGVDTGVGLGVGPGVGLAVGRSVAGLHRRSSRLSTNPSGQVVTQCGAWLPPVCISSGAAQTSGVGGGVGDGVGPGVGLALGMGVGARVGAGEGDADGALVGESVGALLGAGVGALVGERVGALLGAGVGALVGESVGTLLGAGVGRAMHAVCPTRPCV